MSHYYSKVDADSLLSLVNASDCVEYFDTSSLVSEMDETEVLKGGLNMKLIQFVLSIILALCAIGMLYGAITTSSPMKLMSIVIMGIICIGTFAFVRIAYTELHE